MNQSRMGMSMGLRWYRVGCFALCVLAILSITVGGYTIQQTSDNGGAQARQIGQSFTTIGSGGITTINLRVSIVQNANTTLRVYKGELAQQIYSQSVTLTPGPNDIALTSPVYVEANTVYSFRIDDENGFRRDSTNPYGGGQMFAMGSAYPAKDLWFQVVIDETYKPDIVVSGDSLDLYGKCDAGVCTDGAARVGSSYITLRNNGSIGYSGNVPVRFTLYDDTSCPGVAVDSWTETFSVTLAAPGGTALVRLSDHDVTCNMCENSTGCLVVIYIEADYSDTIVELDETNNSRCSSIIAVLIADIEVAAQSLTVTASGDSEVTVSGTLTLANAGCRDLMANVPVRFRLYDNTGCAGTQVAQWTETFTGVDIDGSGGTQQFTITSETIAVNLCDNSTACQMSIHIHADYNNTIPECDGTNNTSCADKTVSIPDIEVSADSLTVAASNEGEATVSGTLTLINNGCGSNLTTNVPVRFTLYDNTGCAGTVVDQWTETLTGVNIAAGGGTQAFTILNRIITVNLCDDSTGCQVSIRIEADYSDTIDECDGTNNTRCANKNVDIPDIEVSADSLTVAASADGEVTVSGTIALTNSGCGSNLTTNVPVQFTLYDNTGCVGTVVAQWIETLTGVNIAAGGGTQAFTISNRIITASLCDDSTGCQVSIRIEADYSDTIDECDGTNNQRCANKNVDIPNIEVSADSLTVAASDDGEAAVSGTVTLRNSGCGSNVTADVPVRFTLYDNTGCAGTVVDQWTETLTGVNIAAGGGTQAFTISNRIITTNLCDDSAGCQVSIRVEADPNDVIWGCDGTDNTYCADNKNVDIPDIEITSNTLVLAASDDGEVTVSGTVTLTNNGCGSNLTTNVPVQFTLYDNTGCAGIVVDQWTETLTGVNIAAGGGTQVFTITDYAIATNLCDNSTGCQVSIRVEADYSDTIDECDGTNNVYCVDNKFVDIPNIEVSADTLTVAASADGEVTVSGTIALTNSGCGSNLTTNVPVRFTLFDNTGCSGIVIDQWTETLTGVNIAAGGGTQAFTIMDHVITTNLCDNSTGCQVSIGIEADTINAIWECFGPDNARCADKAVDIPDIEVSADTLAVEASHDGEVTVSGTVTLTNNGCGSNLTANVPVRFTLYDNTGCTGTQVTQWTETLTGVNIAAGGGMQVFMITSHAITTNLCDNSTNCQVSIHIEADYGDVICECDGTDNTRCTSKNVDIPDLTVTNIDFSNVGCSTDGLSGTVDVTIRNDGCGTATSIPVALACDGGPTFANQMVASLAGSGASTTVAFTISGNWSDCTDCSHQFTATVDPGNTICECDGTDNDLTETYTSTLPDIEVTADALGVTCSADGQVTVSGTITLKNNGCGSNLTANVPVQFTLYDNTGCTGSVVDQWSETLTGVNIAAGGGTQVFMITSCAITTNLCDNSTGCQVSIRVEADYGDAICECDGTDNTYCADHKYVNIPDIEVTADTLAVAASADGQVTISGTITLTNAGCGPNLTSDVPVRFTLYDNTGCAGGVLNQWTETLSSVNIAAGGGTQAFTITDRVITTNLCDNSTGCQVSIHVEADYSDAIDECDGTDNTYCADNKNVDIPDLALSSDALTVTCTQTGVTVSGTITLTNNGCGSNLTANVPMQFALYDNTGCSGTMVDQWTETLTGVNIAAGGGTQVLTITSRDITYDLCGCQNVSLHIEADPTDAIWECDGTDNERCSNKTVIDTVKPVIRDLRVDEHVLVDDCCEAVVTFDGYVEDNCCMVPVDIAFTVTNPTNNATVEFTREDVSFTDTGKYRVDFVGEIHVSCLTSCPAFVVVTVNATDSCGNSADTVASVPDPVDLNYNGGDLYDETAPEPRDDRFRLIVRADDTLFQLDVIQNDIDNCSSCTCCGTMWIHDIVNTPEHGTATIEVDHGDCNGGSSIGYSPDEGYFGRDEFIYRIVDACGNVSSTATVFVNLIAETVMDDIYLTACANNSISFEIEATDPRINPIDPSEIPFVFSIVTAPLHGVISGDFWDVTYAADGGIKSATITLVYTPATGFTGRDALTLRFADPFGGSSTAVVDIAVIECAGQPGGPPLFVVQQGEIFPLIVPLTFAVVYEKEWHTVTVQAIDATGMLYNEALSATWEESINRYVLRLETASLPPGLYRMTIPLGNGETVTLMIEVGEAV